jgi:hypothetical protein
MVMVMVMADRCGRSQQLSGHDFSSYSVMISAVIRSRFQQLFGHDFSGCATESLPAALYIPHTYQRGMKVKEAAILVLKPVRHNQAWSSLQK